MTGPSILSYLDLRVLPTGRRLFVLYAMRRVAVELGMTSLVAEIDEAIAHEKECLKKEARWATRKNNTSQARGEAIVVDGRIDKLISSIDSIVTGFDSGEDDDPQAVSAAKVREAVLPQGVGAITSKTFEEQLGAVDTMIGFFDGELADDVKVLGLTNKVAKLRELTEEFRAELEKTKPQTITWDEVSGAQTEGQVLLGDVIVEILATHKKRDPETVARRAKLLAEYDRQARLVYEAQRRRRRVLDVNPETGEEVAPPDGDSAVADAA